MLLLPCSTFTWVLGSTPVLTLAQQALLLTEPSSSPLHTDFKKSLFTFQVHFLLLVGNYFFQNFEFLLNCLLYMVSSNFYHFFSIDKVFSPCFLPRFLLVFGVLQVELHACLLADTLIFDMLCAL